MTKRNSKESELKKRILQSIIVEKVESRNLFKDNVEEGMIKSFFYIPEEKLKLLELKAMDENKDVNDVVVALIEEYIVSKQGI